MGGGRGRPGLTGTGLGSERTLQRFEVCKVIGYSRQQFYEIPRNFQTYGTEGLVDRLPGTKGPHPNRCRPRSSRRCLTARWPTSATARCTSSRNCA